MRIDDQARRRPVPTAIIAGGQHEKGLGTVSARDPTDPQTAARRALDTDRHAIVEPVVTVVGQRRCVELGGN